MGRLWRNALLLNGTLADNFRCWQACLDNVLDDEEERERKLEEGEERKEGSERFVKKK